MPFILAIDQGTTNSRAMVFTQAGEVKGQHQIEFKQYYPQAGWVEHNPDELWQTTLNCCREVIAKASLRAKDIMTIGISNQRETTILWDKTTGQPIYPAIVWQDRRTAEYCRRLATQSNVSEMIVQKTGLLLDPYFSASKIVWLLEHVPDAREKAINGELAFGTVDSFLLWRLTAGKRHATDATNASRTLLFNIYTQQWDPELLELFQIPAVILPEVLDSNAHFGKTDKTLWGCAIPITGIAGDQQAATVGQACFDSGMVKCTYGTGGFLLLNSGNRVIHSRNRLLSTVAYRINGQVTYGLEGSFFIAGAAVKWLRDQLHLIADANETQTMARHIEETGGVYLVPAFTGLGAPYWEPDARGALLGLTRDTGVDHIVRAALEAVCYQTRDLILAMLEDYQGKLGAIRVDGGMVANHWLLQFLSDMINVVVERPQCIETSALGVAYLAGLGVGIYGSVDEIRQLWTCNQRFTPNMDEGKREVLYCGWLDAVKRVLGRSTK